MKLLLVSFICVMAPLLSSAGPGLQILRERVVAGLLEPPVNETDVKDLVNSIREDGSWPGINYEDTSRTGFEHEQHLENLLELGRVYRKPGSVYYNSPEIKQAAASALDFWLEHDFISENWWWNEIGTPERMVDFLLLMDEALIEAQKQQAALIAARGNLDAWGARPGGDLIKIAGIFAKYGLLKRDTAIVEEAVQAMVGEIEFAVERGTPSDLRGLQVDLSFHHRHDRVTSTLSYGLQFARVFAGWAATVAGTEFSFPDKSIRLLVDFYLDGICRTMAYGKYPDPGAKNRDITRRGALEAAGTEIPQHLLQASSYRQEELERIIKIRQGEEKPELAGNKFFWCSEYFSHQRPAYFTSVRMYSSRNHSVEEPYNGEGLMNHHLADGSNFISRTGQEYAGIFPVWDWQKIPGTTVLQQPSLPSEEEIQQKGLTDFVGAVSDGRYGAAAFDFKSPLDPLKAKKAWFLFDREYVCLGIGIQSDGAYPVATTLNQCLLKNEVVVKQKSGKSILDPGAHSLAATSWVFHDSIAYLFPAATAAKLANKPASGNWKRINRQSSNTSEEVKMDVFKLWLDHGTQPQNASYAYIVVPGTGIPEIEKYARDSPIEILANSPEIQAVKHTGLNISQIVFYEAGEIVITERLRIIIDSPGLVMVRSEGSSVKKIAVADPSRKLKSIHLRITTRLNVNNSNFKAVWNEKEGFSDIYIDLPQGPYAGKSAIIEI